MQMTNIEIRKIELAEIKKLQEISKLTFVETFAEHNTIEDMQTYLYDNLSIEKLTVELSNENSQFYFASHNNKIIGYLKINFAQAQSELKDTSSVEIERIYVLKNYHGKTVGQVLFDVAISIAKQTNAEYVWLGVWEKNPRAINFYKKNGFVEFDKHIFKLGNDEQTDIMMRLELSAC